MSSPLFRICTTQCSTFLRLFQAIENVVTDCSVVVTSAGLFIDCLEPSMVAMLRVSLQADRFEYFHCPAPQQFGIRTSAFRKALEPPEKDVKLTLEMLVDKRDEVVLRKENTLTGEAAEFRLCSLDYDQEMIQMPDLEYPNRLRFSCQWLSGHLRRAAEWGDAINFVIPDELDRLRLEVRGDIANSVVYEVGGVTAPAVMPTVVDAVKAVAVAAEAAAEGVGGGGDRDGDGDGDREESGSRVPKKRPRGLDEGGSGTGAEGKRRRAEGSGEDGEALASQAPVAGSTFGQPMSIGFSLRILNLISKAFRLCDYVDVGLQKDFPICLTFDVHQLGKVVFAVAPRIEDDD